MLQKCWCKIHIVQVTCLILTFKTQSFSRFRMQRYQNKKIKKKPFSGISKSRVGILLYCKIGKKKKNLFSDFQNQGRSDVSLLHRPLFIKFSLLTTFLGRRGSRIGAVVVLNGRMSWHAILIFRIILISKRSYRSRLVGCGQSNNIFLGGLIEKLWSIYLSILCFLNNIKNNSSNPLTHNLSM